MIINVPLWNTTVAKLDAALAAEIAAGESAIAVLCGLLGRLGFKRLAAVVETQGVKL